jgi:hypothetical protein
MLARVRAGIWERPAPPQTLAGYDHGEDPPLYRDYSDWWLQAKVDGLIGEGPISDNT